MKVYFLVLLLINSVDIFSETGPEITQRRELWEPEGMYPMILFDDEDENKHTKDTEIYVDQYHETTKSFLRLFRNNYNVKPFEMLIGTWYLKDEHGSIKEIGGKYETAYRFFINKQDGKYVYYIGGIKKELYTNQKGEYYFSSPWWGILSKIILIDENIYIYGLEDEYWMLDEIHQGGKYFYTR